MGTSVEINCGLCGQFVGQHRCHAEWPTSPASRVSVEELRGHLRYLLEYDGPGHAHEVRGQWDKDGSDCVHCARLVLARAALEDS